MIKGCVFVWWVVGCGVGCGVGRGVGWGGGGVWRVEGNGGGEEGGKWGESRVSVVRWEDEREERGGERGSGL